MNELLDKQSEKYEMLLDFVKSFKRRAYDAWKPVRVFRSDEQVLRDEIKEDIYNELEVEANNILESIGENN